MNLFENHIFSVSELTFLIKESLEESFRAVSIEGEISNFKIASSGHWYFQLNDNEATISAIMFKNRSWNLSSAPKDGDKVVVKGSLSLYAKRGSYQVICDSITLSGTGDILLLLEKRKQEFASLGYFEQSRKKSLPKYPKRVGIVTSPTAAALQDIIQTFGRRAKAIELLVYPSLVQGENAADNIAKQITRANKEKLVDILIVGRGGGSLEDLLPFSEKVVVEAIYQSVIPVVSGVGHEIDFALSDFVADVRASTPTAAAEIISEPFLNLSQLVKRYSEDLASLVKNRISLAKKEAMVFTFERMREYLGTRLSTIKITLDDLKEEIFNTVSKRIENLEYRYKLQKSNLETLNPIKVLERGYAIVTTEENKVVFDANTLKVEEQIEITFSKGKVTAKTVSIKEK
ncbi:MAG: exodeoxyribonuclease VII large subunit [Sphaerochaetaceae bacterium]